MIERYRTWLAATIVVLGATVFPPVEPQATRGDALWMGTWSTAAQPAVPGQAHTFARQTVRLIARVSAGGTRVRIRLSNVYGDRPLIVDRAHIARRVVAAQIDPASDRALTFDGRPQATIAARTSMLSDPVDLILPALGELAVSLYFKGSAIATTSHALALQTSYVSNAGDFTGATAFPVAETIDTWPFLAAIDVASPARGAAIVAFGSSTTDGDGTTMDANRRWPDLLAERLHTGPGTGRAPGVLNQGIIGNRLLFDSPPRSPFGPLLGEAATRRFDRDVLEQAGVRYVIVGLGINDITFPGLPFTPPSQQVTLAAIVDGYRQLIARARRAGLHVILTTLGPFEGRVFTGGGLNVPQFTPERERLRQAVNAWIRSTTEVHGVVDFDAVIRDPGRPTRLLPAYDSGDHLHVNDAGNAAQAAAIPLTLFTDR